MRGNGLTYFIAGLCLVAIYIAAWCLYHLAIPQDTTWQQEKMVLLEDVFGDRDIIFIDEKGK